MKTNQCDCYEWYATPFEQLHHNVNMFKIGEKQ